MIPRVSVIVRSYNRMPALCELLEALLAQKHDSFEVVVVEQSNRYEEKDNENLKKLASDPRINIFNYGHPIGGPEARNTGVQNARGEIVIFIDDDDLPATDSWISDHEEAFKDEKLVGFTGRHVTEKGEACPYVSWMLWFIRKSCMSYSWLKTPYTFAKFDENVEGVEWLHGTNSSIRREWALEAGLWDTEVKNQDEHSFAFKLKPMLKNGFRLDFRKEPQLIRRLDMEGGMEKRSFTFSREFQNHWHYLTKVVYRYHPFFVVLFPLHLVWAILKSAKYKIRGA